jgi:hypothetical protein
MTKETLFPLVAAGLLGSVFPSITQQPGPPAVRLRDFRSELLVETGSDRARYVCFLRKGCRRVCGYPPKSSGERS